jgi:hypothetical protein
MFNVNQRDRTSEDRFELVLRLGQLRGSQTADAAASRFRAQALVKDILRSRLDVEAEAGTGNYLCAQGFNDLSKALAASRALQLAFEGFRSVAPGARTHISVVLDSISSEEALSRRAGPSVEQKDLLALAKTSQVLVTQALFERVAACQPLALRSFPRCAGVYEFLWTSVDRLDKLQAEADFVPELVVERAEPVTNADATVIYRPVENVIIPVAQEIERPVVPEPVADQDYEEPVRSRSKIWIAALACVAILLLSITVLLRFRPSIGSLPHAARVKASPPPPVARPPVTPPPVNTDPQTAPPPPRDSTPMRPTVDGTATETSPTRLDERPVHSHQPTSPSMPSGDTKVPTKPGTRGCPDGVSIPYLLSQGNNYRNRRQLDKAEEEFQRVLQCDHGNRDAQLGLAKVKEDRDSN